MGAATRITPATLTADAICKPCAADSFAKDGATTCVAQLACGDQVAADTCTTKKDRLTDATLLVAGTCADCSDGTWGVTSGLTDCATYTAAGNKTANCLAQTVCGNLLAGGTR